MRKQTAFKARQLFGCLVEVLPETVIVVGAASGLVGNATASWDGNFISLYGGLVRFDCFCCFDCFNHGFDLVGEKRFSEERDSLREKIGQGKKYFQIFEES